MGRIVSEVTVSSGGNTVCVVALVDTGASHLVLPKSFLERFKTDGLEAQAEEMELADGTVKTVEVVGPFTLQIGSFMRIHTDVVFAEGTFEPLLGYIPLEQSKIAVDMIGHRLLDAKKFDLKVATATARPQLPLVAVGRAVC